MAKEKAETYKKLTRLPFVYLIFKLACKKMMSQSYPKEGWNVEWEQNNQEEIAFNMKSCVYHETVCRYQCPELCTVFCENDVTVFGALAPKIIFKRSETIGEGKSRCDFHYYNGKRYFKDGIGLVFEEYGKNK